MKKLFLEIESQRNRIKEVENLMFQANSEFGLSENDYNKMMIGVTEIAINAIVHGNKENISKKVKLSVEYNSEKMIITICDEGEGFDYENLQDPTSPENIMDVHGRGIFIAKAMVDDLKYTHRKDNGSEFILTVYKKG
ncbi:MAG: ATP-binding protein [Ignavibacteria bacterium]|nr:ATP-binding protein [Ignavibacteria bacterium]